MTDREALQQIANIANAQLGVTPPVIPVDPPVEPPVQPPVQPPAGAVDLSDRAMHAPLGFAENQSVDFFFRTSVLGTAEVVLVPQAGTTAKSAYWTVDGGPEQSFTPSGSDFRVMLLSGWANPGTHTIRVRLTGIKGAGQFGVQAVGAGVGP